MDQGIIQHYRLACPNCYAETNDNGFQLSCSECSTSDLLQCVYSRTDFEFDKDEGIYKFHNWLPVRRHVRGGKLPAVFQSERLAAAMGCLNL